jgi:type 1 fimbria pilin
MVAKRILVVFLLAAAALALAAPTVDVTGTFVPNGIVQISITGQDAETCGIEIRDPANSVVYLNEITLSNGAGSVQWRIPSDARTGIYTIYVTCTISGPTTRTITIMQLVGGEAKKDYTPFFTTLAVAALAAASFVIARRELKG